MESEYLKYDSVSDEDPVASTSAKPCHSLGKEISWICLMMTVLSVHMKNEKNYRSHYRPCSKLALTCSRKQLHRG